MPEPKRPLKVFLCHAHADRDSVRALYTRLTQDGVDAWLDKAKLLPGQDWELEIRKAVREADVVVVCLSKQFNQAGFRQKEVRLALDTAMEKPEGEIFIIPARLEECDNLESLRKWHWVDLFEDDGYEMLMRALRARADKIGSTLQTKKSWLPIGNTQPAVVKKLFPPVEKPVEKKQEKPKSKKEIQKPRISNKIVIANVIMFTLAAIFGLRQFIGKPEPTPTATNTESFKTFTSISETFTPISASKTETLVPTSTPSGPIFVRDIRNSSPIVTLAFSPDAKTLLVGSEDGAIRVWQTDNGNLLNTIKGNYWYNPHTQYAFSPDGKTVASGSWKDFSVKVVQISDNTVIQSVAVKNNGSAISIAMSHDGNMLAVSYWVDNVVRLWQVNNGKLLYTLAGLGNRISFSNDNKMVGILYENELKVWNTINGSLIYSLTDIIESFAFSPDNNILVLGLSDGTISLRRGNDGGEILTLDGHTEGVKVLSFSPDGEILASGASDKTIKLWNTTDKKLLFTISEGVSGIKSLTFSGDGQMLVSGADDGSIKLWNFVH
jgi:WD40 repeat protein